MDTTKITDAVIEAAAHAGHEAQRAVRLAKGDRSVRAWEDERDGVRNALVERLRQLIEGDDVSTAEERVVLLPVAGCVFDALVGIHAHSAEPTEEPKPETAPEVAPLPPEVPAPPPTVPAEPPAPTGDASATVSGEGDAPKS